MMDDQGLTNRTLSKHYGFGHPYDTGSGASHDLCPSAVGMTSLGQSENGKVEDSMYVLEGVGLAGAGELLESCPEGSWAQVCS